METKNYAKSNYYRHREKILARRRLYRKSNPEKMHEQRSRYGISDRRKLKEEILKAYGNKCAICGESHFECLTLDHSYGDGGGRNRKIRGGHPLYRWLRQNDYPKNLGLRVLCWNCNCSIGVYGYSPYEVNYEKNTVIKISEKIRNPSHKSTSKRS